MTTTVDDRGRVLIPKELRAQAGIEPGQEVRPEIDENGNVSIQPVLSAEKLLETMLGAINEDTRRADAEPIDPLDLKRMWELSP